MNDKKKDKENGGIDTVIRTLIKSWGIENKMKELDIIDAWPELMGKGVAHRTERLYISNKVLYIKLNSSVMREELQFGRNIIVGRINEFAGYEIVKDIWFE